MMPWTAYGAVASVLSGVTLLCIAAIVALFTDPWSVWDELLLKVALCAITVGVLFLMITVLLHIKVQL